MKRTRTGLAGRSGPVLDGKRVQLIVLPPDGQVTVRLGQQRSTDYRRRVEETLSVLADLRAGLDPEAQQRLDVRELREDVPMPYMLAGNERLMITAAYPIAAQSSGTMLAVTVDTQTRFGFAIREDLKWLVERYSVPARLGDPGGDGAAAEDGGRSPSEKQPADDR